MVLFEELTILGPSPSSAQLLEYNIHSSVPDNPYEEILFAKLILRASTMPLVRSRQIVSKYHSTASIGYASFDEAARAEDTVKMGHPSFFRFNGDDRDYVVSIVTGPGDKSNWELDTDICRDDKYALLAKKEPDVQILRHLV
ncbi:hypothetical protein CFIO01_09180 [Colletotrichum fioriniae PJ7]|uniref:Uncharacterized protein n=1 Tax=Colletotrichum fioriniae PJ7 TaxID=1445577 RepID=A0A010SAM6_9PEZI|nr:hypothetical protein CFIO01_09180 [Colletotrichum fioriniae PJ7]